MLGDAPNVAARVQAAANASNGSLDVGGGETSAFNPGDLLFEERFNRAALDQLLSDLGEGPYSAQILQLSVISLFEGVKATPRHRPI